MARIHDYLLKKWDHPRKADVVSKVIGDFRGRDNLATYAKAFPRFLDALNRPQQALKAGLPRVAAPQIKSPFRSTPRRLSSAPGREFQAIHLDVQVAYPWMWSGRSPVRGWSGG
jgi:hypothetical protein